MESEYTVAGGDKLSVPVGSDQVRNRLDYSHPLEYHEKNFFAIDQAREWEEAGKMFGAHVPLRMAMEHKLYSKPLRMGGLPCSNALLNSVTGNDETISFDDYLNPVEFREKEPRFNIMK